MFQGRLPGAIEALRQQDGKHRAWRPAAGRSHHVDALKYSLAVDSGSPQAEGGVRDERSTSCSGRRYISSSGATENIRDH